MKRIYILFLGLIVISSCTADRDGELIAKMESEIANEIQPLRLEDFALRDPKSGETIALMDRRDTHEFLANVEHFGEYKGVIIEYSDSLDQVEMIYSMVTDEIDFLTPRNIQIGSTRKEVLSVYGPISPNAYLEEPTDLEYLLEVDPKQWNQLWVELFILRFKFEEGRVTKIIVESYYPF